MYFVKCFLILCSSFLWINCSDVGGVLWTPEGKPPPGGGIPEVDPLTFITEWNTTNDGVSGDNQIQLPLISTGTYNFSVDWGDGNTNVIRSWNQEEVTHTYDAPGTVNIRIMGSLAGFSFGDPATETTDRGKITGISNWGGISFGDDASHAFNHCSNLIITATDTPNLTNTTNLSNMFESAAGITSIGTWDVSNVTNMSSMFKSAQMFTQDISGWDISSVTDMSSMFESAMIFNQDISGWDLSNVTSCSLFSDNSGLVMLHIPTFMACTP